MVDVDVVNGVASFETDIDSSGDYMVVANGNGTNLDLSVEVVEPRDKYEGVIIFYPVFILGSEVAFKNFYLDGDNNIKAIELDVNLYTVDGTKLVYPTSITNGDMQKIVFTKLELNGIEILPLNSNSVYSYQYTLAFNGTIANSIAMDDIISDGVVPFEITVTYSETGSEYVLTGTVDPDTKVVTRTDGYPNGGALPQ